MKSNTETFRSFRFWTILVPLITTAVMLIASTKLWIGLDDGTANTPLWSLIGYSAGCAFITACFTLLHFYGNAWVDSCRNSWVGSSYSEKALDCLFVTEKLDWRLRQSANAAIAVMLWTSPIGLAINVVGIGIAIVRAIILTAIKICEFLWSCRPGIDEFKQC
jgi:hypothetical protein